MDCKKASFIQGTPQVVINQSANAEFPAFAPIMSDTFDHLTGLPEAKAVRSGNVLIPQGVKVESVFLLFDGLVKLSHVFPDGREMTLGLRSSGSYMGAACVLTNMLSMYSMTAVTPCRISPIPADDFPLKLLQNARLMRHFISTMCQESMSQSACQAQLMASSAEGRLKHFMRERKATHKSMKTLDILPLLKKMELAQLLAISPEHLSRLTRKLSTIQEQKQTEMNNMIA